VGFALILVAYAYMWEDKKMDALDYYNVWKRIDELDINLEEKASAVFSFLDDRPIEERFTNGVVACVCELILEIWERFNRQKTS